MILRSVDYREFSEYSKQKLKKKNLSKRPPLKSNPKINSKKGKKLNPQTNILYLLNIPVARKPFFLQMDTINVGSPSACTRARSKHFRASATVGCAGLSLMRWEGVASGSCSPVPALLSIIFLSCNFVLWRSRLWLHSARGQRRNWEMIRESNLHTKSQTNNLRTNLQIWF